MAPSDDTFGLGSITPLPAAPAVPAGKGMQLGGMGGMAGGIGGRGTGGGGMMRAGMGGSGLDTTAAKPNEDFFNTASAPKAVDPLSSLGMAPKPPILAPPPAASDAKGGGPLRGMVAGGMAGGMGGSGMGGGGVMGGGMGGDGMMGCGGMGGSLGVMGGMGSALPAAPACGAMCVGSVMQPMSSAPPPKANAGAAAFGALDPLSMLSSNLNGQRRHSLGRKR